MILDRPDLLLPLEGEAGWGVYRADGWDARLRRAPPPPTPPRGEGRRDSILVYGIAL